MRWPPELKERVAALHEAGLSAEQIRNEIDLGISRNAIIGALNRIAGYRRSEHPPGADPLVERKPKPPKKPTVAKLARSPMMRPKPPPPEPPKPAAPLAPVSLLAHHEGQCRFIVAEPRNCKFPLGEATGNHWFYCGAPVIKHSSWCARHYAIVCA